MEAHPSVRRQPVDPVVAQVTQPRLFARRAEAVMKRQRLRERQETRPRQRAHVFELADVVMARIEELDPSTLERGDAVAHPLNPRGLIFIEYRGEMSLVLGYPDGVKVGEPSEFEVSSDELMRTPGQEVQVVVIGIHGPGCMCGTDEDVDGPDDRPPQLTE